MLHAQLPIKCAVHDSAQLQAARVPTLLDRRLAVAAHEAAGQLGMRLPEERAARHGHAREPLGVAPLPARRPERAQEVGAAVADDYATPLIRRTSIGLRLPRGASPGLRAYRVWMIEHPADDSRISSPIVKAVLRP